MTGSSRTILSGSEREHSCLLPLPRRHSAAFAVLLCYRRRLKCCPTVHWHIVRPPLTSLAITWIGHWPDGALSETRNSLHRRTWHLRFFHRIRCWEAFRSCRQALICNGRTTRWLGWTNVNFRSLWSLACFALCQIWCLPMMNHLRMRNFCLNKLDFACRYFCSIACWYLTLTIFHSFSALILKVTRCDPRLISSSC